jgi:hypothetical protein
MTSKSSPQAEHRKSRLRFSESMHRPQPTQRS